MSLGFIIFETIRYFRLLSMKMMRRRNVNMHYSDYRENAIHWGLLSLYYIWIYHETHDSGWCFLLCINIHIKIAHSIWNVRKSLHEFFFILIIRSWRCSISFFFPFAPFLISFFSSLVRFCDLISRRNKLCFDYFDFDEAVTLYDCGCRECQFWNQEVND